MIVVTSKRFSRGMSSKVVVIIFFLIQIIVQQASTQQVSSERAQKSWVDNALTPREWALKFNCNGEPDEKLNQTNISTQTCLRTPNYWLIKQDEELWHSYKFLVAEDSIDERYADLVFGYNLRIGLNFHHYVIKSGSQTRDDILREHVAGERVNDELCKRHLQQMVALADDLSLRVGKKRQHSTINEKTYTLDERHFRLARVLDSFGRYESGHLNGRYHSFGMYKQCITTQMLMGHGEKLVASRYCWARMNLEKHLSEPLHYKNTTDHLVGDFKYHMGICLPESCHTKSFSNDQENLKLVQRIVDSQYQRPRAIWIDSSLPVDSVFCLVDKDSKVAQLRPSGWLFLVFISCWLALCVLATLKHKGKRHSASGLPTTVIATAKVKRHSFLEHFDLHESWHEYLGNRDIERPSSGVELNNLSLVSMLAGGAVIVVHSLIMSLNTNVNALEGYAMMEYNRAEMLMYAGVLVVDSFFVIAGLLMTYVVLKRFDQIEQRRNGTELTAENNDTSRTDGTKGVSILSLEFYKTWLYISAARYFRLVPLYFIAFWFKKSIFIHLADSGGPYWDYGLNKETQIGVCHRQSWLSPFNPMTAYELPVDQCLPQSWTISNDLMFALTLPPFILSIRRYFKPTCIAIVLAIVGSTVVGYFSYLSIDPTYRLIAEKLHARALIIGFRAASILYTGPEFHVPAIFVGLFAGYALHSYERRVSRVKHDVQHESMIPLNSRHEGDGELSPTSVAIVQEEETKANEPGWPSWFRGFATKQALTFAVLSFVLSLFTIEIRDSTGDGVKNSLINYLLISGHLNWSLACAIILLRLITDWNDIYLVRLFGARIFRCVAKLGYAMLLIHWDILHYDIMNITQPTQMNKWEFGKTSCMVYVYAWPLSLIIYVVLENPLKKLTKTYLLRS